MAAKRHGPSQASADSRHRVGEAVWRARSRRNWSVETAAAKSGVGHMTWRRIERGDTVQSRSYSAVDRAFTWPAGHTLDAMLTDQPPTDPTAGAAQQSEPEGSPLSRVTGLADALTYPELVELQRAIARTVDGKTAQLNEIRALYDKAQQQLTSTTAAATPDPGEAPPEVARRYLQAYAECNRYQDRLLRLAGEVNDVEQGRAGADAAALVDLNHRMSSAGDELHAALERFTTAREALAPHDTPER